MPLTYKEVAEILKLIDASDCDEVVLELEGTRLVVRRNASGQAFIDPGKAPAGDNPAPAGSAGPAPSPSVAEPTATAPAEPGVVDVRAPMVGTFYRRPSPEEPVFVEEGGEVKKGDPLCLIEVMKLFTTIEAPADGTIVSIAPEDGTLVEYNQLLFQIRS